MGLFGNYAKPGSGIPKDAPPKRGLALFFDVLSREFFELVKLNLLYLLFCVPVVTIPAATTAMCRVTLTMLRDQNHFLWHDFFSAFRREFKWSTLLGLPLLALILLCDGALRFYGAAALTSPVYGIPLFAGGVLLLLLLCAALYLFPMLALVDLPPRQALNNTLLLALLCLPRNLLALAVIGALGFLLAATLPMSLIYLLLIGCSLTCLVACFCAYGGIRKHVLR